MKRLALPIVGCAVPLLLAAVPVFGHVPGDGPVADLCAACHRAHTAKGALLLTFSSETASQAARGDIRQRTSRTRAKNDAQERVGRSGEGRSGGVGAASRGSGLVYALIDPARPPGYRQVDDTNAPGFLANVSAWCSTCPTRYLAPSRGAKNSSARR